MKIQQLIPGVSAGSLFFAALLLSLAPVTAVGQQKPADGGLVRGETLASSPGLLWGQSRSASPVAPSAAERLIDLPISSTEHVSIVAPEGNDVRKRMMPYALIGALLGGVMGYAVEGASEPCDSERNLGCPVRPYAYVTMGAAAGMLIGYVTGSLVEKR